MAARTTISLEEFLRLPEYEEDGTHYELDEGQLVILSPTGGRHAFLMSQITVYLNELLRPAQFTVLCGDVGFILDEREDRSTVRGADIAVRKAHPAETELPEGMFHEAPIVAIEIISASNTKQDMERKVKQYLRAGGQEVWVVDPATKQTTVFRAATQQPDIYQRAQSFESCLGVAINTSKFFSR